MKQHRSKTWRMNNFSSPCETVIQEKSPPETESKLFATLSLLPHPFSVAEHRSHDLGRFLSSTRSPPMPPSLDQIRWLLSWNERKIAGMSVTLLQMCKEFMVEWQWNEFSAATRVGIPSHRSELVSITAPSYDEVLKQSRQTKSSNEVVSTSTCRGKPFKSHFMFILSKHKGPRVKVP